MTRAIAMENRLLSFSEERLWHAAQEQARAPAFVECPTHLTSVVRLIGRLDTRALAASFHALLERHEVLRSTFTQEGGDLVRVIADSASVLAASPDLDTPETCRRDAAIGDCLAATINRSFDLAAGPLLRIRLLALADDEHVLAVIVHHIVFDGWSMQIMWRELSALYGLFTTGQPHLLPELRTTYAAYALWQRGAIAGSRLQDLLTYWRAQMHGAPEVTVPGDRPHCERPSTRSGTVRVTVDGALAQRLREQCRAWGVTSGVAMAAIFNVALHRLSGAEDLTIGMPIADRDRSRFEPLIGLFLNLLVLRTDASHQPTFLTLLSRVRQAFIEAYKHREFPYGCLWAATDPETRRSVAPVRVIFNFFVARGKSASLPGLRVEGLEIASDAPSLADFSMHLFDTGASMNGFVLYKADLFSRARIEACIALFVQVLAEIVERPDQPIGDYGRADTAAAGKTPCGA